MTDTTGTTPPTDSTTPDGATEHQGDAAPAPNREAAKYRLRLREAEAAHGALQTAHDALQGRVEQLLRRDVERLAGDRLAQAGDIFEYGDAALSDLVDPETGDIDPHRVSATVDALITSRPLLARHRQGPDFGAGNRGSAVTASGSGWGEVLGQGRRR